MQKNHVAFGLAAKVCKLSARAVPGEIIDIFSGYVCNLFGSPAIKSLAPDI